MRRITVPSPTLYLYVCDETLVIDLFHACRWLREWGDLRQQDEIPSQVTQENGSMWLECFLTIRVQRFRQPQTVQLCLQPWLPPTLTPHQPPPASTRVADLLLNTIILRRYSWYLVRYSLTCEINNSSLSWNNRLISADNVTGECLFDRDTIVFGTYYWTNNTSINKRYS